MLETQTLIEVPFHDVDMFSIVWHGNYPRYLEIARCKLLDKIGYDYMAMEQSGFVFPVVDLQLRYEKPIVFRQQILVIARLREWQNWIKISYEILDNNTGTRLTKGTTRQVAMALSTMTMLDECPSIWFEKVKIALDLDAIANAGKRD